MKLEGVFSNLELAINNFCSLSCEGCPSLNISHSRSRYLDYLPVVNILKLFSFNEILFCGNDGEPLEHPDIAKCIRRFFLYFPESKIRIATNGEKIEEAFSIENLLEVKDRLSFDIAVDGSTQEIHQITRKKGNLEKVFSSVNYLQKLGMSLRIITSRHRDNEHDCIKLSEKTKDYFSIAPLFRDTSVVTSKIHPPKNIGKKSDVSLLYDSKLKKKSYSPRYDNLFVNSNGDCFPCVSFTKYKFKEPIINIFSYDKSSLFLEDYTKFSRVFCTDYQENGDIRQCQLNCGIYRENYEYDVLEDIKK